MIESMTDLETDAPPSTVRDPRGGPRFTTVPETPDALREAIQLRERLAARA